MLLIERESRLLKINDLLRCIDYSLQEAKVILMEMGWKKFLQKQVRFVMFSSPNYLSPPARNIDSLYGKMPLSRIHYSELSPSHSRARDTNQIRNLFSPVKTVFFTSQGRKFLEDAGDVFWLFLHWK
ncbi:hypothetical protein AVEN_10686-1 [Araneus ventricosus]|uniref:Uncharacterized protein n=1 Tax=Araneus ventricosus TaxID=182803 RepID=A0A4Y2EW02_ARAVE|nr:hypothetical protein AVEN_10686-1 [Araneus ventricosus]